jgi:hypothetical protein
MKEKNNKKRDVNKEKEKRLREDENREKKE